MDVELKLEPGRTKPKVVILAGAETARLQELVRCLSGLTLDPIPVWQDNQVFFLEPEQILRFYTDGKGVSAQTQTGIFSVRRRLYELEESLDGHVFVRISNSEIVNLNQVTAVDLSLTGTIRMTLAGGSVCYVSRRCVKKIRQALDV